MIDSIFCEPVEDDDPPDSEYLSDIVKAEAEEFCEDENNSRLITLLEREEERIEDVKDSTDSFIYELVGSVDQPRYYYDVQSVPVAAGAQYDEWLYLDNPVFSHIDAPNGTFMHVDRGSNFFALAGYSRNAWLDNVPY